MQETVAAVSVARSMHAWGPIVVNRPARAERRRLKVVAFNACSGRFLDEIAARLKRPPLNYPDLILLSEMDWHMGRSGRRETAAELAAELGMSFAYVGEFGIPQANAGPGSFVGNAILSSRPLVEVRALPMARTFVGRRFRWLLGTQAGLAARIVVNRRPIALGIAHLNSRRNPACRELQIRQFLQAFPSEGAAILGGDFNTTTVDLPRLRSLIKAMALTLVHARRFRNPQRWEPLFERLREAGFETNGANVDGKGTFTPSRLVPPIIRPKLDWLALRGVKPVTGSALVVPARGSPLSRRFSDHDFVTCSVHV